MKKFKQIFVKLFLVSLVVTHLYGVIYEKKIPGPLHLFILITSFISLKSIKDNYKNNEISKLNYHISIILVIIAIIVIIILFLYQYNYINL